MSLQILEVSNQIVDATTFSTTLFHLRGTHGALLRNKREPVTLLDGKINLHVMLRHEVHRRWLDVAEVNTFVDPAWSDERRVQFVRMICCHDNHATWGIYYPIQNIQEASKIQ